MTSNTKHFSVSQIISSVILRILGKTVHKDMHLRKVTFRSITASSRLQSTTELEHKSAK